MTESDLPGRDPDCRVWFQEAADGAHVYCSEHQWEGPVGASCPGDSHRRPDKPDEYNLLPRRVIADRRDPKPQSMKKIEFCCPQCGGHSFRTTNTKTMVRQCSSEVVRVRDGELEMIYCRYEWQQEDDWRHFREVRKFLNPEAYQRTLQQREMQLQAKDSPG